MTSDRLEDLWPSLTQTDMERIVDSAQEDPGWMTEIPPWDHDEIRDACWQELRVLRQEVAKRSPDGHPVLGDNYRIMRTPAENGRFNLGVERDESSDSNK